MSKVQIPSISQIGEFLQHLPTTAILNWLRVNDKPHTTKNTSSFYKNLNKWISEGKLTIEDLNEAVYDIEESGGKRVYLRVLIGDLPRNKKQFDDFLDKAAIPSIAKYPRSVRNSSRPTLNHILWNEAGNASYITIKYSEMQEEIIFDPETFQAETLSRPVFIIIKIDVLSGFTEFRFDTPAKRHIHKDSEGQSNAKVFESFYFNKVQALFTNIQIEQYGLIEVAEDIVQNGADYFRINREQTTTTGNGKQTYSCGSHGDVRELPARIGASKADGKNWIYDDITGYWMAATSEGALPNDLFMRLSKVDSSLRFHRDCLGTELNYAITKIREIKKGISGV